MLYDLYRTGFVQRYHSNPEMAHLGQTDGHHQWGVAILLLALFPAEEVNLVLVWEGLHHDVGEMGSADVSAPAKRQHPKLGAAAAEAEALERIDLGVPEAILTGREMQMLKLCDSLESILFARVRAPWVLEGDGWPEQIAGVKGAAWALGVGAEIEGLLKEAGL